MTVDGDHGATIVKDGWSARYVDENMGGFAGAGWYVWATDYPEEGAAFFETEEEVHKFIEEEGQVDSE